MNLPPIVILCNKKDRFLLQLCVSSIRYYYKDADIYIVKDVLKGKFSTGELEKKFNVKVLDLGLKNYGWGTGKISLLSGKYFKGQKILILDADIVFVGKVLDVLITEMKEADFIISPEYHNNEYSEWFRRVYYDMQWAKEEFPGHHFPGYSFNTGQMIVSPGKIDPRTFEKYIELKKFPYWNKAYADKFPCKDQSLLNIVLPCMEASNQLKIARLPFQLWSESQKVKDDIELDKVTHDGYPYLIHWAGAIRIPHLDNMTRSDILYFFQKKYYEELFMGSLRRRAINFYNSCSYSIINTIRKVKRKK